MKRSPWAPHFHRPPPSPLNQVCILALFSLKRVSKIVEPKVTKAPSSLDLDLCKDGVRPATCKEIFVESTYNDIINILLKILVK